MNLLVLDSETTGFDPEEGHRAVEIAGAVIDLDRLKVTETFDQLVDPKMPIPPEAMGVHHILDRQVVGKPTIEEAMNKFVAALPLFVPVAHNAEFDKKFIPIETDWICTFRCAKHLWPEAPSYSNQTLRYYLKLFREPEARAMPPHRARADVWVTAHIVIRMLKERGVEKPLGYSVKDLIELTKQPILLRKVHFGKHVGTPWAEVPKDYLAWIIRQGDFDRDVLHTARHYGG